jgi:hypothetical protein
MRETLYLREDRKFFVDYMCVEISFLWTFSTVLQQSIKD